MAQEVGGILVNLGLDVAQIRQDVGKAQRELSGFRNQVNRQMVKARRSVDKLTNGFRGLVAIVGGAALVRGINNSAKALEEVNRQAEALGAQRSTIQELVFTFRQFNLQQDDVSDALGTLSDRAQDAKDGMKSFQEDFKLLGIEVDDLRGKQPGELFRLMAQRIAQIEDPTRRTAGVVRIFGDDLGRRLLPLLQQGADGLRRYAREAREVGAVQSDELVKSGADAAKTFRELQEVIDAQFVRAVANSADELERTAKALTSIVTGASKATSAIVGLGQKLQVGAGEFDLFKAENLEGVNSELERLRKNLDRMQNQRARANPETVERIKESIRILEARRRMLRREQSMAGEEGATGGTSQGTGGAGGGESPDGGMVRLYGPNGLLTTSNPFNAYGRSLDASANKAKQAGQEIGNVQDELTDRQRKLNRVTDQLNFTFSSALENAIVKGKEAREVMQGLAEDVQRIFLRQTVTKPAGNFLAQAVMGAFSGGGAANTVTNPSGTQMGIPSFAGGGYTGMGPSSGGVDGRGGFPAILHPNETVTPGRGSNNITINLNGVGNADDVRRAIPQLVGAMKRLERSVPGMAVAAVSEARARS